MTTLRMQRRLGAGWYLSPIDYRLTTHKRSDESVSYTIDFSGYLGGDTISTATWEMSGAVNDASSNTTTAVTIRVSGLGTAKLTLVTSASETLEFQFRWAPIDGAGIQDYS
jgi:hypothetical protein